MRMLRETCEEDGLLGEGILINGICLDGIERIYRRENGWKLLSCE